MCKFGVTGMVPAKLENEVPPNFNTHIKNQRMPIGSNGYTLKREFAVALKKIISRCTFKLKGGGWYSDGYSSSLFGTEN